MYRFVQPGDEDVMVPEDKFDFDFIEDVNYDWFSDKFIIALQVQLGREWYLIWNDDNDAVRFFIAMMQHFAPDQVQF